MRREIAVMTLAVATLAAGCSEPTTAEPTRLGAVRDSALPTSTPATTVKQTPTPSPPATTPTPTPTPTPTAEPIRYTFPVSPAEAASYGQVHHDYPASDVFAPCGSDVLAVTSGVVEEVSVVDRWDPSTDDPAIRGGLSVTLVGADGVRYYFSHLLDITPAATPGARVEAGALIAHVGDTGNAAGTGCHVHFGISPACGPGDWAVRRGTIYPWPYLDAWRDGGQTSPVADVATWLQSHLDQCPKPAPQ